MSMNPVIMCPHCGAKQSKAVTPAGMATTFVLCGTYKCGSFQGGEPAGCGKSFAIYSRVKVQFQAVALPELVTETEDPE